MNTKKKRNKNRRRARRLADQAWDAADKNNFDLAVKIIRRAVDLNPGNPVLWNDQGLLLRKSNDDNDAAKSFQAAISLATDFAEAYANLADIRARRGKIEQAVALQREALRYAPESQQYRKALTAYEVLVERGANSVPPLVKPELESNGDDGRTDSTLKIEFPALAWRVDNLNWQKFEDSLTRHGYAHVRELLSSNQCETLRKMFDDDALFSKTVTMDKSRFGMGVYRYFDAPIPSFVDAIRRLFYPHCARSWSRVLPAPACHRTQSARRFAGERL